MQLYFDAKHKDIFQKYTSWVKTLFPVAIAAASCKFSRCSFTEWELFLVQLLVLKAQRQEDASFSVIQNSRNKFSQEENLLII